MTNSKEASNSSDITNPDNLTNSVRPELVEGFLINKLAIVLKQYQKTFQKFDIFVKNEFVYPEKDRARIIEALLLANLLEHATLLRSLSESPQRVYAPLAAVFRGIFESTAKLIWLQLGFPSLARHKQLDRNSIHEEWVLKKELYKIGLLSKLELSKNEVELTKYIKKIDSKYTLSIPKEEKLTLKNITKEIAPYFRESERDLYAIYRIYSGSLHGNLEALGRQYIKNDSIYLFNHSPERFIEIYGLSNEILESIIQLFQKTKSNPLTSSGRTGVN
jgi:Family of unknown function (DUF5677)